jgi:hypothetical protein
MNVVRKQEGDAGTMDTGLVPLAALSVLKNATQELKSPNGISSGRLNKV